MGPPAPHSTSLYLQVGGSSMLHIQAQRFVRAAFPDEVSCVQSDILVQDFIILQQGHGGTMAGLGCVSRPSAGLTELSH